MSIYGSTIRKAPAIPAHAPDTGSVRVVRDRHRPGPRGRTTRRSANQARQRAPMDRMTAPEASHEAGDGPAQATEDGLDPAFDEIGELHDHIDGLSAWMRLGRTHPGFQGD